MTCFWEVWIDSKTVGTERITQRLIALALLLLMTVVVATSQPGLRYCFCFGTASLGGCECLSSSQCEDGGVACAADPCGHEAEGEQVYLKTCGNCSVEIFVDLDEFVDVTVRGALEKTFPSHVPGNSVIRDYNASPPLRCAGFDEARGSPPLPVEYSSAPLRVRYLVFLV